MKTKKQMRAKRKLRIRAKIAGTADRPRVAFYRSNTTLSAQLVDDEAHITVASARTKGKNREAAKALASDIVQKAKEKKITTVVFDRGGFRYHGVVADFATALREGGLKV